MKRPTVRDQLKYLCVSWFIFILALSLSLISGCSNNTARAELQEAFERYLTALNDSYITLDASHLSDVAVNPSLDRLVSGVENRKKFTKIVAEEFEIEWVKVISYQDTEATIQVKFNYRGFTQNLETGERTYGPTDRWYWRIIQADLVKDNGVWKVKETGFIDWSG